MLVEAGGGPGIYQNHGGILPGKFCSVLDEAMDLLLAIRALIARITAQNDKNDGRVSDAIRELNWFSQRCAQLKIRSLLSNFGCLCGRSRSTRHSEAKGGDHEKRAKYGGGEEVLALVPLGCPGSHLDLLYRCRWKSHACRGRGAAPDGARSREIRPLQAKSYAARNI